VSRRGNRFQRRFGWTTAVAAACVGGAAIFGVPGLDAWGLGGLGPNTARGVETVTVTLIGGTKITAPLLRQNDEGVVLDLGYDVLHVPAKKLLDVEKRQPKSNDKPAVGAQQIAEQGLYTTGRLEAAEVPELVRRHGDSVVMIRNAAGRGSGFLISKQGHLITNYHVIEGQSRVQVELFRRTPQGYERHDLKKVRILAFHPLRDIALLQLEPSELPGEMPAPVVLAEKDDLRVGDLIFAVGNPLGLERTVTQGIVSSTTRRMGNLRMIQTDAAINPGNSGGPLFNARGEIVGIVCAGATSFDGLAFGIPVSELVDFLKHRETFLYDPAQPLNGITYMQPPFRAPPSPVPTPESGPATSEPIAKPSPAAPPASKPPAETASRPKPAPRPDGPKADASKPPAADSSQAPTAGVPKSAAPKPDAPKPDSPKPDSPAGGASQPAAPRP
jgi:serine protease Do